MPDLITLTRLAWLTYLVAVALGFVLGCAAMSAWLRWRARRSR